MDKGRKKQKARPLIALRKMMQLSVTHKEVALSHFCIGAFFFAMRSCKYLRCSHYEDSKRTKILRLRNIRFKKEGLALDHMSPLILQADLVATHLNFRRTIRGIKQSICSVLMMSYYAQSGHGPQQLRDYGIQYH